MGRRGEKGLIEAPNQDDRCGSAWKEKGRVIEEFILPFPDDG